MKHPLIFWEEVIWFKFTTTGNSNFAKRCSDTHFVSFLFYYTVHRELDRWNATNALYFSVLESWLDMYYWTFSKMSYALTRYSTILFTLKMESVSKNTIFGLKMMVKTEKWSRKIYFEIPPCRETTFPYFIKGPKITNSVL